MGIKVSVIIPVYNAEKYLAECIESLLNQTLKQCEFIFVNDGSTDQSKPIIESYKKEDTRIILINQENQGVSVARNNGLKIASGEYVGFVDADDYIKKDMYEVMYSVAKKNDCDVIISNFATTQNKMKLVSEFPFPIGENLDMKFIYSEIIPYLIKSDRLNAIWNKLYKTQIIKEQNIQFPKKISLGEDGLFNVNFFSKATKAQYIDYYGYHYREVIGSATRNISNRDYFYEALKIYNLEVPEIKDGISKLKVNKLKSIKLIRCVIDYVHLYYTPTKGLGFWKRYLYVSKMIRNKDVRSALALFENDRYCSLSRYELTIIKLIKLKSTFGLYFVTAYSRFRNR